MSASPPPPTDPELPENNGGAGEIDQADEFILTDEMAVDDEVVLDAIVVPDEPPSSSPPRSPLPTVSPHLAGVAPVADRPPRPPVRIGFGRVGWIVGLATIVLCSLWAIFVMPGAYPLAELLWPAAAFVGFVVSVIGVCRWRREGVLHGVFGIGIGCLALLVTLIGIGLTRAPPEVREQILQPRVRREAPRPQPAPESIAPGSIVSESDTTTETVPAHLEAEVPKRARPAYPVSLQQYEEKFTGESVSKSLLPEHQYPNAPPLQLKLSTEQVLPGPVFSDDGKLMYVLTTRGQLMKVTVPEFNVVREVKLGRGCLSLCWSQRRLVVAKQDGDLLIEIDPKTLDGQGWRVPGGVMFCVGSPGTPLVFMQHGRGNSNVARIPGMPWRVNGEAIRVFDLSTHQILQEVWGDELTARSSGLRPGATPPKIALGYLLVSPDGRYLFAASDDTVHRFAIRRDGVAYEESGPVFERAGFFYRPRMLSSQLVRPARSPAPANHPRVSTGYYIYSLEDQNRPVSAFELEDPAGNILWDEKAEKYYLINIYGQLMVVTRKGESVGRFDLRIGSGACGVACPQEGRMFVDTGQHYLWLQVPNTNSEPGDFTVQGEFIYPASPRSAKGQAVDEAGEVKTGQYDGVTVRSVSFPNASAEQLAWSADGAQLFCVFGGDRLCSLDPQTLNIQRSTDFPRVHEPKLSLSAEGIVIFGKSDEVVYTMAADTLDARHKVHLPEVYVFATSAASPYAFVGRRDGTYQLVDLKTGKIVQQLRVEFLEARLRDVLGNVGLDMDQRGSHFTADGKWLLCFHGGLHRFSVSGATLKHEVSLPFEERQLGALHVSPNSRKLALFEILPWNRATNRYRDRGSIYVYNLSDFERPARTIAIELAWVPLAVDCSGAVFTLDSIDTGTLLGFDPSGQPFVDCDLVGGGHGILSSMVPHPTRPGVLAALGGTFGDQICIIEIDGRGDGQ